ncbi:MAG TPA: AAA family ATPase [Acidimicrobiia bacterium]|nr:AAA family ATPase [Acidimicrobiia bacterium]
MRKTHIFGFDPRVPFRMPRRAAEEPREDRPALHLVPSDASESGASRPARGDRGGFGDALRARRIASHLSQEALAERAGVSVRTISDLERGIHLRPRRSTLDALARAFEVEAPAAARITALRGDGDPARRLPAHLWPRPDELPLVARDEALARARREWRRVRDGGRAAMAFVGEAGIGKSRVLAEIAAEVLADDAVVLAGRCDGPSMPYGALVDALRPRLAGDMLDTLGSEIGAHSDHLALLLPELGSRTTAPAAHTDRDAGRARLLDAVDELIATIGAGSPVVLIVDDLHAADVSTLGVLRHLVRSSRPSPLFVLGAYRTAEAGAALTDLYEDLHRDRLLARIELSGLDRSDLRTLAEAHTGAQLADDVVDLLTLQTGGNPFFLEELLTSARERNASLAVVLEGVPQNVREVVRARVQRLSEHARHALDVAAVVGKTFDLGVMGQVVGADALAGLDEAATYGFVDRSGDQFAFRHAIVRAALLHDMRPHEVAAIHWRVGEALERLHAADLDSAASEIADHLQRGARAGDPAKAARYLERAGDLQFRSLALDEAVASFSGALELTSPGEPGNLRRMRLLELIAEIHFWRNDPDAMRAAALGAAELARESGSPDDLARTIVVAARWSRGGELDTRMLDLLDDALAGLAPTDHAARSQVLAMRAYTLQAAGCGFPTREIAEEAERTARRSGDAEALALTLLVRCYTEAGAPTVDHRLRIATDLERAAARVLREDHRQQYHSFALGARLQAQLAAGDLAGFAETRCELETIADQRRAPFLRSQLMFLDASLLLAEGKLDAAVERSSRALATWSARPDVLRVFAVQHAIAALERGEHASVLPTIDALSAGNVNSLGYAARALVAAALAASGDIDGARRRLDELAADGFDAFCDDHLRPQALRWLCEAVVSLRAEDHAATLLPIAEPYGGLLLVGPVAATIECGADRAIAQLFATLGHLEEAVGRYERAAALEAELGFTALALHTRRWLAEAIRDRDHDGDDERSRGLALDTGARARRIGMRALADACCRVTS